MPHFPNLSHILRKMNGSANSNGANGSIHEPSFLEAAAEAGATTSSDIENQQRDLDASTAQEQGAPAIAKTDEETETISTFQDILTTNHDPSNLWILSDDDNVPFPSVNESTQEMNELVNVCPCRCLFFTLKETICMVMSALGCAVFVTGMVFLIMFLEGSWFENDG
jgi:hypothetical protein